MKRVNDFVESGAILIDDALRELGPKLCAEWSGDEVSTDLKRNFSMSEHDFVFRSMSLHLAFKYCDPLSLEWPRAVVRGCFNLVGGTVPDHEFEVYRRNQEGFDGAAIENLFERLDLICPFLRIHTGIRFLPLKEDGSELIPPTEDNQKMLVDTLMKGREKYRLFDEHRRRLRSVFMELRQVLYEQPEYAWFFTDDGHKISPPKNQWSSRDGWEIFLKTERDLEDEEVGPLQLSVRLLDLISVKSAKRKNASSSYGERRKEIASPRMMLAEKLRKPRVGCPPDKKKAVFAFLDTHPEYLSEEISGANLCRSINNHLKALPSDQRPVDAVGVDTARKARKTYIEMREAEK